MPLLGPKKKSAGNGGVPTSADGSNARAGPRGGRTPIGIAAPIAVPVAPMPMAAALSVGDRRDLAGIGGNSARQADDRSRRNAGRSQRQRSHRCRGKGCGLAGLYGRHGDLLDLLLGLPGGAFAACWIRQDWQWQCLGRRLPQFGSSTVSMTWITPFDCMTLAIVTLA